MSSSKPSPATRMLFRGNSSSLSAPEVSSVAVTGVTSLQPPETTPSSPSRSRTESVSSSPSFISKGKSPLSLLSGSTPSISGPSASMTIVCSSSHRTSSQPHHQSSSQLPHQPSQSHPHPQSTAPSTRTLPTAPPDSRSIEEARTALLATLSNHFDREISPRAQLLHRNNAAIEKQQNDLVKATAGLKKENDKLAKMVDGYSKKVKEVGNVQNWAEMLEREFLIMEDTLRRVREGNTESEGSWSGSYSGSDWSGSDDNEEGTRPEEVPLPEPDGAEGL